MKKFNIKVEDIISEVYDLEALQKEAKIAPKLKIAPSDLVHHSHRNFVRANNLQK